MRTSIFALAASLGLALSTPSIAADLKPVQSQAIDLGLVAGDAYYTVAPDGLHVTATFAERGATTTPVRFQAVLAPGQALTFSAPRAVGEAPLTVSLKRQDEHLVVAKAALTD